MAYRRIAYLIFAGAFAAVLASPHASSAQKAPSTRGVAQHEGQPTVRASLVVHPDDRLAPRVGVVFEMAEGWHIYWKNSGESGLPTTVEFTGKGGRVQPLVWPVPDRFEEKAPTETEPPLVTYGYADRTLIQATVIPEKGSTLSVLRAEVDLVSCREACVPARFHLEGRLEDLRGRRADWVRGVFAESSTRIPIAPTIAGFEIEPYLSHSAVRPGDHFELGFAIRGRGQSLPPIDQLLLFPERTPGLRFASARISPHPADENALWMAVPGEYAVDVPDRGSMRFAAVLQVSGASPARSIEISSSIPVAAVGAAVRAQALPWNVDDSGERRGSWWGALLLGLVGGLILNLMPCVLPILALKSFAVVEIAEKGRRDALLEGVAYASGVLVSMALLASAVIFLRSLGTAVGWGFQLQEPAFLVAIASLVMLFAMNLFGAYEIPAPSFTSVGANARGRGKSFFEGFLAVALATPCSAPFLGTAVGFAFAASALETFAIFLAVGVGLASPFLVISSAPALHRFLPRGGPWMAQMRTVLGFALLATVLWLLWILGRVVGPDESAAASAWLLLLAVGVWLYGVFQFSGFAWLRTALLGTLAAGLLAGPGVVRIESPTGKKGAITAQPVRSFEAGAVETVLEAGLPAFVFFTADWCITCKVNEKRVLADQEILAELEARQVRIFRADLTQRSPELLAVLNRYGRAGVPLYLLFDPSAPENPVILPDLLTKDVFLERLYAAVGTQSARL